MEEGKRGSRRSRIGGILSLAKFVIEHRKAVEYDLLTRTGYQIEDIGGALSWSALSSFVSFLGTDSALARDMGRSTGWEETLKTNAMLADLYDLIQVLNANICRSRKKIKPYPRPGKEAEDTKRIGKQAMPHAELRNWINQRRKDHG